jgi:hypothetical protein
MMKFMNRICHLVGSMCGVVIGIVLLVVNLVSPGKGEDIVCKMEEYLRKN